MPTPQPLPLHSNLQQQSNQPSPQRSACIAHNTTILTECTTSATSHTSSLASLILPKIDHSSPQKLTYTHGSNHIHYIAASPSEYPATQPSAGGLTYLVISDSSAINRRISFGFLVELRRRFLSPQYFPPESTDFSDLPNYGAAAFNGEMRALMVEYGTTARGRDDALGNAQREIEDVRGIMTRNIEGLLERGERIDLLVDKTDRLGGSASEFRVRSRGLKRRMWWKNVKLMGLLGLVVVLILVTVVVSVKNSV
jgi:vesicle-associated membrane protein 7